MWNKIKAWPTTVQLAVVFLTLIWVLAMVAWTGPVTIFTLIILFIASSARVMVYFMGGS